MKITQLLSNKKTSDGYAEVILLMRMKRNGKTIDVRTKTTIMVNSEMYDTTIKEVKEYSSRKLGTSEVVRHNKAVKQLRGLLTHIDVQIGELADKSEITSEWLKSVTLAYLGKECAVQEEKTGTEVVNDEPTIYQLMERYFADKQFTHDYARSNYVAFRCLARYEIFKRKTQDKNYIIDIDTITSEEIDNFKEYMVNEKEISIKYPCIFKQIGKQYPQELRCKDESINQRGNNANYKNLKKIKGFFTWLVKKGITDNKPFDKVDMGAETYATPYYITAEERDMIASTPMPTKHLERQRDIFVFQCLVGCRVSDLTKMDMGNINDGMLVYTPQKTKKEGVQARVPLTDQAMALIEKYKGVDKKGRLFPFISDQKYNDAIKMIFTFANITRMVEVRNALSGEIEKRPLNLVASSHMARRTFIGNLYYKVQDPNIIGKMSGHSEGSSAFNRYRKIEDDTLKDIVSKYM